MRTQLFTNRVMAAMMPFMTLIMNGTSLLIVWFGGKQIDAGTMQVGSMIAFITYTMQIVMSFLMLTMVAVMLPRAGVAADRIDEVLTTEPAIHDPVPEASPLTSISTTGTAKSHSIMSTLPTPAPARTPCTILILSPNPARPRPLSAPPAAAKPVCCI